MTKLGQISLSKISILRRITIIASELATRFTKRRNTGYQKASKT